MRALTKSLLLSALLASTCSATFAKSSGELQNKAEIEASKAAAKQESATNESLNSAEAQSVGDRGKAACHARKAADEQADANKHVDKANKLETKAVDKAVDELK